MPESPPQKNLNLIAHQLSVLLHHDPGLFIELCSLRKLYYELYGEDLTWHTPLNFADWLTSNFSDVLTLVRVPEGRPWLRPVMAVDEHRHQVRHNPHAQNCTQKPFVSLKVVEYRLATLVKSGRTVPLSTFLYLYDSMYSEHFDHINYDCVNPRPFSAIMNSGNLQVSCNPNGIQEIMVSAIEPERLEKMKEDKDVKADLEARTTPRGRRKVITRFEEDLVDCLMCMGMPQASLEPDRVAKIEPIWMIEDKKPQVKVEKACLDNNPVGGSNGNVRSQERENITDDNIITMILIDQEDELDNSVSTNETLCYDNFYKSDKEETVEVKLKGKLNTKSTLHSQPVAHPPYMPQCCIWNGLNNHHKYGPSSSQPPVPSSSQPPVPYSSQTPVPSLSQWFTLLPANSFIQPTFFKLCPASPPAPFANAVGSTELPKRNETLGIPGSPHKEDCEEVSSRDKQEPGDGVSVLDQVLSRFAAANFPTPIPEPNLEPRPQIEQETKPSLKISSKACPSFNSALLFPLVPQIPSCTSPLAFPFPPVPRLSDDMDLDTSDNTVPRIPSCTSPLAFPFPPVPRLSNDMDLDPSGTTVPRSMQATKTPDLTPRSPIKSCIMSGARLDENEPKARYAGSSVIRELSKGGRWGQRSENVEFICHEPVPSADNQSSLSPSAKYRFLRGQSCFGEQTEDDGVSTGACTDPSSSQQRANSWVPPDIFAQLDSDKSSRNPEIEPASTSGSSRYSQSPPSRSFVAASSRSPPLPPLGMFDGQSVDGSRPTSCASSLKQGSPSPVGGEGRTNKLDTGSKGDEGKPPKRHCSPSPRSKAISAHFHPFETFLSPAPVPSQPPTRPHYHLHSMPNPVPTLIPPSRPDIDPDQSDWRRAWDFDHEHNPDVLSMTSDRQASKSQPQSPKRSRFHADGDDGPPCVGDGYINRLDCMAQLTLDSDYENEDGERQFGVYTENDRRRLEVMKRRIMALFENKPHVYMPLGDLPNRWADLHNPLPFNWRDYRTSPGQSLCEFLRATWGDTFTVVEYNPHDPLGFYSQPPHKRREPIRLVKLTREEDRVRTRLLPAGADRWTDEEVTLYRLWACLHPGTRCTLGLLRWVYECVWGWEMGCARLEGLLKAATGWKEVREEGEKGWWEVQNVDPVTNGLLKPKFVELTDSQLFLGRYLIEGVGERKLKRPNEEWGSCRKKRKLSDKKWEEWKKEREADRQEGCCEQ